jgi:hypothetical protein
MQIVEVGKQRTRPGCQRMGETPEVTDPEVDLPPLDSADDGAMDAGSVSELTLAHPTGDPHEPQSDADGRDELPLGHVVNPSSAAAPLVKPDS